MAAPTPSRRLAALKRELARVVDPDRAGYRAWFKTGKGEYAESDKFIGVPMPAQRIIAEKYSALTLHEIEKLLESPIHEHRYTGLLILVAQYETGDAGVRKRIFDFISGTLAASTAGTWWILLRPISWESMCSLDRAVSSIVSLNHQNGGSAGSRWSQLPP
jgi:hypothetical protein